VATETVTATVGTSQSYHLRNQIRSTLRLLPPAPTLRCDTVLRDVGYANVRLNESSARTERVPGSFD
jgi:hypothetical protein